MRLSLSNPKMSFSHHCMTIVACASTTLTTFEHLRRDSSASHSGQSTIHLLTHTSTHLSIHPSIYPNQPFIYPSTHPPIHPFKTSSTHSSICPPIHPHTHPGIHNLPIHQSIIYPPIHLPPTYPPISLYIPTPPCAHPPGQPYHHIHCHSSFTRR